MVLGPYEGNDLHNKKQSKIGPTMSRSECVPILMVYTLLDF